jgi:small subunit ribosomal protein S13
LTDEKKKTEKKAVDATKEPEKEPVEKPQPASEEKVEGSISEEPKKEDAVETSEKVEEKPDVKKVDKPVLETPTEEKTVEDEGKPEKEEAKEQQIEAVETSEGKEEKPDVKKVDKPVLETPTEEKTQSKETRSKEKPGETKPQKVTEEPKKPAKKQDEVDEDFQYIVRIANTDIDGAKTLIMGIAQIKGIGRHMAVLIADATGIDKKIKMGKITDAQIEKIKKALEDIQNIAPGWMLNHRKDIDTGKDIHLISSEVELRLRDDVNLLKMIRSYRGIRHETGLSVRGQRTRANNRRGLALGVSKKRPGA